MNRSLSISSFKIVAKLIVFLLIVMLVTHFLNLSIYRKSSPELVWNNIYNADLQFDYIAFGNSHNFATLNTTIMNACGLPSINVGASSEYFPQTYYSVLEVLKYRQPKVIIVELNALLYDDVDDYEKRLKYIYHSLFGMKIAKNRINAMRESLPSSLYISALTPMVLYHQNWKDFLEFYKNYKYNTNVENIVSNFAPQTYIIKDETWENMQKSGRAETYQKMNIEPIAISGENMQKLAHLVSVCRSKNIDLILYKSPVADARFYAIAKRFELIEQELGVEIIDYNFLYDELQLTQEDYYDGGHVNTNGANKVTLNLIEEILQGQYGHACDLEALAATYITKHISYKKQNASTYEFSVAHYNPNLFYRFVILKDNVEFEQTEYGREGSLAYTFTQPGVYKVSYQAIDDKKTENASVVKSETFNIVIEIGE